MRGTNQSGTISRNGTATTKVFEALVEEHGIGVVCDHTIDYESARFSNAFMAAVSKGLLPILGTEEQGRPSQPGRHYHHMIIDGEVWVAYFPEEE